MAFLVCRREPNLVPPNHRRRPGPAGQHNFPVDVFRLTPLSRQGLATWNVPRAMRPTKLRPISQAGYRCCKKQPDQSEALGQIVSSVSVSFAFKKHCALLHHSHQTREKFGRSHSRHRHARKQKQGGYFLLSSCQIKTKAGANSLGAVAIQSLIVSDLNQPPSESSSGSSRNGPSCSRR